MSTTFLRASAWLRTSSTLLAGTSRPRYRLLRKPWMFFRAGRLIALHVLDCPSADPRKKTWLNFLCLNCVDFSSRFPQIALLREKLLWPQVALVRNWRHNPNVDRDLGRIIQFSHHSCFEFELFLRTVDGLQRAEVVFRASRSISSVTRRRTGACPRAFLLVPRRPSLLPAPGSWVCAES